MNTKSDLRKAEWAMVFCVTSLERLNNGPEAEFSQLSPSEDLFWQ